MKRPDDTITIESVGGEVSVVVDRAMNYELAMSLRQPSIARFEVGDDRTWGAWRDVTRIGGQFRILVNNQPRLKGRMLTRNMPLSSDAGATVQLTVRTHLADAAFTACTPGLEVRGVTLQKLVLLAFERQGLTEADFDFRADLARDVITGRRSGQPNAAAGIRARLARLEQDTSASLEEITRQKRVLNQSLQGAETRPVVPDLVEIQVAQANVQPGETVRAFVDRHLYRHGLMMWDGSDGRIVIGHPDDSQTPLYLLACLRDRAQSAANNIESASRLEDYEQVPTALWVYGRDGGKGYAVKGSVKASERDAVLSAIEPPLDRIVMILDQGVKTQELAEARARREMLGRSLAKDAWVLQTDGFSYWSGRERIPYAIDTVAELRVDLAERADGPYLIHECVMNGTPAGGHSTRLTAVGKGIWVL